MTFSKSAGGGRAPVRYSLISLPWSPAGAAATLAVRFTPEAASEKVSRTTLRAGSAAGCVLAAVGSDPEFTWGRGAMRSLRTCMEVPRERLLHYRDLRT